jgi:hypothetical protein
VAETITNGLLGDLAQVGLLAVRDGGRLRITDQQVDRDGGGALEPLHHLPQREGGIRRRADFFFGHLLHDEGAQFSDERINRCPALLEDLAGSLVCWRGSARISAPVRLRDYWFVPSVNARLAQSGRLQARYSPPQTEEWAERPKMTCPVGLA